MEFYEQTLRPEIFKETKCICFKKSILIDEDYFHHTATVFRGIDDGGRTKVWNAANGFASRNHLKCSCGDFQPRVVLAINDG